MQCPGQTERLGAGGRWRQVLTEMGGKAGEQLKVHDGAVKESLSERRV